MSSGTPPDGGGPPKKPPVPPPAPMRPPPRAPMQPRDYNQFGTANVGGPGGPPPPPPRPVAGAIPYPTQGGAGAASITTGNLLNETFTIFFQNFVPFLFITGIVLLPTIAMNVLIVVGMSQAKSDEALAMILMVAFVPLLLFLLLQPVATGAISYGVFQQVRGKHATFAECVSVGFSRLLPVLGVSFVSGLAIVAGVIACCVPGFYLMVILYVAVPAAVVEQPGVMGALNRSVELTDGFRWSVFGLWFCLAVIGAVLQKLMEFVGTAGSVAGTEAALAITIAASERQGLVIGFCR